MVIYNVSVVFKNIKSTLEYKVDMVVMGSWDRHFIFLWVKFWGFARKSLGGDTSDFSGGRWLVVAVICGYR